MNDILQELREIENELNNIRSLLKINREQADKLEDIFIEYKLKEEDLKEKLRIWKYKHDII